MTLYDFLQPTLLSYRQNVTYLDNLWDICENLELFNIFLDSVLYLKSAMYILFIWTFRKYTKFYLEFDIFFINFYISMGIITKEFQSCFDCWCGNMSVVIVLNNYQNLNINNFTSIFFLSFAEFCMEVIEWCSFISCPVSSRLSIILVEAMY